ncbi:MAG: hypothetical protein K2Y40_22615 [Reyranella sp.]|nr:hypothetical protein [Reyranella sp.]
MSNPLPYLVRMLLFLAAVGGLAYALRVDLLRVFLSTPILNGVILGVLVLGIFFVMRQVISLRPEVIWLRRFQAREVDAPPLETQSINLLSPMAAMLGERQDNFRLSPMATRAVLDGIATRLDERRELTRYTIGLLIFLGLLGTFWGLLETIGAVADAIGGLQVTAGDAVQMFAKLKASIDGPLKGMATAFGASLFGLSGSLVLGFLELQASQAQGRFHIELEEWLASATRISRGSVQAEGEQSVPAYAEAVLEHTAEGLDGLVRSLRRSEDSREATTALGAMLADRLGVLAETMSAQQTLLAHLAEQSILLQRAFERLSERSDGGDREASLGHQRNIEAQLSALVEESARHRALLGSQLQAMIGQLTDRPDSANGDAVLAHQRNIETLLSHLVEESARNRTSVTEELRGVVSQLASRVDGTDNAALLAHQRNVEAMLSNLVEESARSRAMLSSELHAVVDRLAARPQSGDNAALLAHQRNIEGLLTRLLEDGARNRQALAEDLRGELRLLARAIASPARTAGPPSQSEA